MSHWTELFEDLAPQQSFSQHLSFIDQRSQYLGQEIGKRVAAPYPFKITRAVRMEAGDAVTLQGQAWIDVKAIYRQGEETPLACTWFSEGSGASKVFSWQAVMALDRNVNVVTCMAVGFDQLPMATETIAIAGVAQR